jgi:hypothetical protein
MAATNTTSSSMNPAPLSNNMKGGMLSSSCNPSNVKSLSSSSTSSASSTNEQIDAGYSTMNDLQDYDLFNKASSNHQQQPKSNLDMMSFQPANNMMLPPLIKEAERQLMAHQLNQQKLLSSVNLSKIDQCMRRSVPNLLNENQPHDNCETMLSYSNTAHLNNNTNNADNYFSGWFAHFLSRLSYIMNVSL